MNKKLFIIVFIIAVIAVAIALFYPYGQKNQQPPAAESELDQFAKCLASAGATMYGADWCPHCQNEKRAFGSSFQYVSYVECPANPSICLSKGVNAYPTWIFKDGRKFVGEQGLSNLSIESGCLLPAGIK